MRRYGFAASARAAFLAHAELSGSEFKSLARQMAQRQADLFASPLTDSRSPKEMMEDLVPNQRLVQPVDEPFYDLRSIVEKNDEGPLGMKHVLPEMLHVRPPLCSAA